MNLRATMSFSQILTILLFLFASIALLIVNITGAVSPEFTLGILFLVVGVVGVYALTGWMIMFSPLVWYFFNFLLMIYFGALIDAVSNPSPDSMRVIVVFGIMLLTPLIGAFYANAVFRFSPKQEIQRFIQTPLVENRTQTYFFRMILIFATVSIIGGLIYYQGEIPITRSISTLISGEDLLSVRAQLSASRALITKGDVFDLTEYSGRGLWVQFIQGILPVLSFIAFLASGYYKQRRWFLLTFVLVVISLIFLGGAGKRSPVLIYGAGLFTLETLRQSRRIYRVSMRTIFLVSFIVGGFLTTSVLLPRYAANDGMSAAVESVANRFIQGNALNAVFIVDSFPDVFPYFEGQVLQSDLVDLIPGRSGDLNLPNWIAQQLGRGKLTTYASSTGFSTLYADFGFWGAFVGMTVLGFFLQASMILLIRRRKDIVNLATFGLVVMATMPITIGTILAPLGIIPTFLFIWLIRNNKPPQAEGEVLPTAPDTAPPLFNPRVTNR